MILRKAFSPKNLLIFIIVAASFHYLWKYRNNDPLTAGHKVPDFEFRTLDNQTFTLNDVNIPVLLVFLSSGSPFSNTIYPRVVLRKLPEMKIMQDKGYAFVIVLMDTEQTPDNIEKILDKKRYKILENITYLSDTEKMAEYFGVRSWPHFFMLNDENVIVYQDKIPSNNKILRILRGI